jgi:hypothetical protein
MTKLDHQTNNQTSPVTTTHKADLVQLDIQVLVDPVVILKQNMRVPMEAKPSEDFQVVLEAQTHSSTNRCLLTLPTCS